MHPQTLSDLQFNCLLYKKEPDAWQQLTDAFRQPLLNMLASAFGSYLRHDQSLAEEAVYLTLKSYQDHPCHFQPHKGSLFIYLQLAASRHMQQLLHQQNRTWHFQQLDHQLARFIYNEQDLMMAKLIIRKKYDWCLFAQILDIGCLPIEELLREIERNVRRVRQLLALADVDFSVFSPVPKRKEAILA
jgi:hypothetical protein